jgi:hypothetical protein
MLGELGDRFLRIAKTVRETRGDASALATSSLISPSIGSAWATRGYAATTSSSVRAPSKAPSETWSACASMARACDWRRDRAEMVLHLRCTHLNGPTHSTTTWRRVLSSSQPNLLPLVRTMPNISSYTKLHDPKPGSAPIALADVLSQNRRHSGGIRSMGCISPGTGVINARSR